MWRLAVSRSLLFTGALAAALAGLLLSTPAGADEADDQYAVAAGHYARQRWKFAAEEFRTLLKEYPNHPNVDRSVFFLAEALLQLGQREEAETLFRDYLKRDSAARLARPALFRAAEAAYLSGKFDRAKTDLQRFLTQYRDDNLAAHVLAYLGQIALAEDDLGLAEESFRQSLNRFPQSPVQDECRVGLGRTLEKQGNTEEAERFFLAVAGKTASPFADDAQFYLGALQYALGRFPEAVETFVAFDSTLAESPRRSTARLGCGWALLKLDRPGEAESIFNDLQSDPKVGVEARYWLGMAQKAQKKWQVAARTLQEAAAAYPGHKLAPAMRFHAGDCLIHAGDMAGAIRRLDQAIDSAPPESEWIDDAVRGKIQVALKAGDHDRLEREVTRFAARFPNSPLKSDVRRMLGRSLLRRKLYDRAADVLEPLAHAGDAKRGLENQYLLSLAYEGLGRHREALATLAPVVDSATGRLRADAQLTRASLLMMLKRFDEAIPPLEAFLATRPTGDTAVRATGNLAICRARTGRVDQAKQIYAGLLQTHPGHELIVPIREQLAEAAYDADDTAWSGRLFESLAAENGSPESGLKGLSGLAWSQFQAGQLEEAAATFGRLLEKDPPPGMAAEAALVRGGILEELGRLDAALAMYDLAIRQSSESDRLPEALWAAAKLRDHLGNDEEAASLYQRLASDYPQFPEIDAALYRWAWALSDLGRPDEACAVFERLQKEYPNSAYRADATYRLAEHAFNAHDYPSAQRQIAILLAGNPGVQIRESALYLQGQIAAAEGKWDAARQSFQSVIEADPESPVRVLAEYQIAETTFRQGNSEEAAQRFRRLVQQTSNRDDAWLAVVHLRLAQSLSAQKKWDEAYAAAAEIEPKYPGFKEQYEVDYVLGRCLANEADLEGARAAYQKVIRSPFGAKTETAAKAQLMIAESYYHQKDYETALRAYQALEILYDYPEWQAAAVFMAAKCHELLGEWKEAVELYERLLEVYPESRFREEATGRLRAAKHRAAEFSS